MKITLNEGQLDVLKLPPFIYKAIKEKRTSLGDNPAFPPYGNFGFEYDVIKKKYIDVSKAIDGFIESGEIESNDVEYLISYISKLTTECKKIESSLRPQLQKLCENIVCKSFSVPSETILLSCKLVDKIKPKNGIRVLPEDSESGDNIYTFEDIDELEMANKIILKRRFINSLIQGISYWLSIDIDEWRDEVDKLNDRLWGLWTKIIIINNYLLFNKQEKIDNKTPMQLSYVEVHVGKKGKKTEINAQGKLFPYLLRETFRGFLEMFSSHGLPENVSKAMYIVRKADFLVAEPWDLRFGMGIVELLKNSLTDKYGSKLMSDTARIPFFFTDLCSMEVDEFNNTIKNFIIGTKKGKIIADYFDKKISNDFDYQEFKDKIKQKNLSTSLISDGDFSKDELDNYVLQENETNEMMAYHGSGADFDKFNHKKYLNTGAGSQTFGWGTYVTNDEAVAKGYSDNAKSFKGDTESYIANYLIVNYNYNPNDAETEAHDIMYNFRWAGSLQEFIELCKNGATAEYNDEKRREMNLRWLDILTNLPMNEAYLYEVDIPEDNGSNYIDWYEYFPPHFMKKILQCFLRIHDKHLDMMAEKNYPFRCDLYNKIKWMKENPAQADKMMNIICSNDDYDTFFSSGFYTAHATNDGKSVYNRLRSIFGSDKAASLFLMQCGFDGIKYPSGTKWKKPDGASEDAYNYVIFDANKVKIVNKTEI